ncbi:MULTISPECIES: alpha/beta fold hydrolase BchO [Sphingomonas]|uniref:alpha/beta fold hydrolase BchO n=1 Tax=Sphingomonas TaxID=13687 RepID=UPI00082FD6AE|nr:alpha/beta fold hydrolase BchO [Sphingomonas sp. CCH10-B3]
MLSDRPEWEREGRDWPNREASRFVTVGRLRWHVQVAGEGPVLLLLHGTGAATHSWRSLLPLLAERFTVVAPDLPGHGFTSGRPPGGLSMTAMARAVSELLGALTVTPRLIIGHSAGVAVAVRMTLDGLATPTGIIGLNSALMPFPGIAARLFPTLARMLFVNPFAPHIFAGIARQQGEVGGFLKRSTGSRIDADGANLYQRLFATPAHCAGAITMMADWDLDSLNRDLPKLAVPLLLVHGESDAMIPPSSARDAAALVPGARVETLAGLGHLAHEEAPEQVAALIERFVAAGVA